MRKPLILLLPAILIICSSFGTYFFTWAGISATQTVTRANLYNACINSPYFQIKGTFDHTSLQCVTKSQVDLYVYIDNSNTTYSAKATNQLVVKQDLTNPTFSTFFPHSHSTAYSTSGGACGSSYTNGAWFTSSNAAPIAGNIIYSDSGLTTPVNGGSQWFELQYATSTYVIQIDASGVVLSVYGGTCTPN